MESKAARVARFIRMEFVKCADGWFLVQRKTRKSRKSSEEPFAVDNKSVTDTVPSRKFVRESKDRQFAEGGKSASKTGQGSLKKILDPVEPVHETDGDIAVPYIPHGCRRNRKRMSAARRCLGQYSYGSYGDYGIEY